MEFVHPPIIPVIIAAIIYMVIGMLWYSPKLFGQTWMDAMGYTMKEMRPNPLTYVGAVVNALLTAYVLALLITQLGVETAYDGACVGFWVWLGFVVTQQFAGVLWESRPFKVFFIGIACMLVTLLLMGAILGSTFLDSWTVVENSSWPSL